MEDVSTLVAQQYKGYPYPPPATDLAESVAQGGYQVGDPSLWRPMLWPEGRPRESLKILIAGCGTTQAAWFAYTNSRCDVFGVDLSEASLAHERFLQDKHGLRNLHLFRGDLRRVSDIGGDFDLVVSTGVLHHMGDPDEGMRALASVLAPEGAIAAMVYGATRRTGVYMLQDAFRRLGVRADGEGVAFVRRTLAALPAWHFANAYTSVATELQHDAAVVDTFLPAHDRAYTVPQVLALVENSGLHFQGWFENSVYYPEGISWLSDELRQRLAELPEHEQWAAVEMLNPAITTHFFFTRRNRAPALSLAAPGWAELIPHQHPGLRRVGPNQYRRAGRSLSLDPSEGALFDLADGARSIGEIISHFKAASPAEAPGDARRLFERLWKQGQVMLSTRRAARPG